MKGIDLSEMPRKRVVYRKFIMDHSSWCTAEDLQEILVDVLSRFHDVERFKKSFAYSCQKIYSKNENSANIGMQEVD